MDNGKTTTTSTSTPAKAIREMLPTRVSRACERCRHNKVRCNFTRPCNECVRADVECVFVARNTQKSRQAKRLTIRSRKAVHPLAWKLRNSEGSVYASTATTRNVESRAVKSPLNLESTPAATKTNSLPTTGQCANEAANNQRAHVDEPSSSVANLMVERVPIACILGQHLPSPNDIHLLLDDYFASMHWLFPVIYEPRFRAAITSVMDGYALPSQKPLLLLIATSLGIAAWYRDRREGSDDGESIEGWGKWSRALLGPVEMHLMHLMDEHSLVAAQTCILLGLHHMYNGRPTLSFTLLGATLNMTGSLGLHLDLEKGDFDEWEERKRVWWAIYSWDRLASTTFGRPLGIAQADFHVNLPRDFEENPHFTRTESEPGTAINYAMFQRQLIKLYKIASPALELILNSNSTQLSHEITSDALSAVVLQVMNDFTQWRTRLPKELALDFHGDAVLDYGCHRSRVHRMQALALRVTADTLMMIMHRPFAIPPVDWLFDGVPTSSQSNVQLYLRLYSGMAGEKTPYASSEEWWNFAIQSLDTAELPIYTCLDSHHHLVMSFTVQLLNAALYMATMALSKPFSSAAHWAKCLLTRILRLQEAVRTGSSISLQSRFILQSLIGLILQQESTVICELPMMAVVEEQATITPLDDGPLPGLITPSTDPVTEGPWTPSLGQCVPQELLPKPGQEVFSTVGDQEIPPEADQKSGTQWPRPAWNAMEERPAREGYFPSPPMRSLDWSRDEIWRYVEDVRNAEYL